MTNSLIVLAGLAIIGGAVGIPFFEGGSPLHHYLEPVFSQNVQHSAAALTENPESAAHGSLELLIMGISTAAGLLGILFAALMYFEPFKSRGPSFMHPEVFSVKFKTLYALLANKYYIDEFYDGLIVNPIKRFCRLCFSFDLAVVDGLVNGAGWITRFAAWLFHKFDIYLVDGIFNSLATLVDLSSGFWRRLQTGYLQNYALLLVLGMLLMIGGVLAIH